MNDLLTSLAIGTTQGLVYGLLALGIVLVYKGTRTLNIAQPFFGLVAAFLCWWLTDKAELWGVQVMPLGAGTKPRFVLAAVLSLVLIGLYGYGVEHGVMRRLQRAPRLVTLVATIALAQGALGLVSLLFNRTEEQASVFRRLPTLLNASFEVGNRVVTGADIQVLILAPAISGALALFFTRTKFGVGVRAAAENAESARLLGINVARVSTFTWVTGAVLAGVAGIAITQIRGSLDVATLSTGFLIRALAAALVGGLTSLPGAMVGGLAVGIIEAMAVAFTDNRQGVPETLLFGIVLLVLLFRPGGLFGQREETEDKVAFVPAIRGLPARLRGTLAARGVMAIATVAVVLLGAIGMVTGPAATGVLTLVVIYAMVAVSLTVLMGYTGQISLGHWALAGVGAFTMANLVGKGSIPYLLGLPLSFVAGMVTAVLIGFVALRLRGLYLSIATLAFSLSAEFFIFREVLGDGTATIGLRPPRYGPLDLDAVSNRPLFLFCAVLLLLTIALARNLAVGRTGRGFLALRENEKAAATMGIGLTKYKLLSFAVSGGIAALAGALYATYLDGARYTAFPTDRSLVLVSVVMIGGLGSLAGPVLGAFVVFGITNLLQFDNPWIVPIGTGILLLVVILRARGGLAGVVSRAGHRIIDDLDQLDRAGSTPASPAPGSPVPGGSPPAAPAAAR